MKNRGVPFDLSISNFYSPQLDSIKSFESCFFTNIFSRSSADSSVEFLNNVKTYALEKVSFCYYMIKYTASLHMGAIENSCCIIEWLIALVTVTGKAHSFCQIALDDQISYSDICKKLNIDSKTFSVYYQFTELNKSVFKATCPDISFLQKELHVIINNCLFFSQLIHDNTYLSTPYNDFLRANEDACTGYKATLLKLCDLRNRDSYVTDLKKTGRETLIKERCYTLHDIQRVLVYIGVFIPTTPNAYHKTRMEYVCISENPDLPDDQDNVDHLIANMGVMDNNKVRGNEKSQSWEEDEEDINQDVASG